MSAIIDVFSIAGNIATIFIAVVSTAATFLARQTIMVQREANAKGLYRDYLKVAFENTELASPTADLSQNEKYQWFVAFMLNSCDEIIAIAPNSKMWKKVILEDLRAHKVYIASTKFKENGGWELYSFQLHDIAKSLIIKDE